MSQFHRYDLTASRKRGAFVAGALLWYVLPLGAEVPTARAVVDHVTVELLAEHKSLQPGSPATVAVAITHQSGWHTYWVNSGDSGLPTRLEWQLPRGFRAGEIAWPAPRRFDVGGIFTFGYDATVLLPVVIDVPAAPSNSTANLVVNAKWLMCSHEICIPGKARLQLDVPIRDAKPVPNENNAALFAQTQSRLPRKASWGGQATLSGDRVRIELRGNNIPAASELDIFPVAAKLLSNAPPRITMVGTHLIVEAGKSEYFESAPGSLQLVLTQRARDQIRAWQIEVPWNAAHRAASN